ncbi:ABC-2 type transport system permease protein [Anoxybacillus calidus]|jgi:ABC-2 type transport system permease protein|uniref:ABC-2 type transport system permease protein n=1 Tax=[Anoxybacillus] calidus TaxID=575178 RepID=A0A7V9Z0T9_9BACL|nr:ABC transporter permease [Anoxybacillus calidus]MBA2872012.1 ABC-2 type transport system permease protein [Anoxybacillus calidus]
MIDGKQLWKQRVIAYFNELKRYLRYMFNDHLLFILLIGIGAGAVAYKQWVNGLSYDFPFAFVVSLVLAPFLTHSPVQTLLKEADLVFLLPAEKQLTPYFQRAFLFSLMMHIYMLLIVIAAISPLYAKFSHVSFLFLFIVLLLLKVWNMWITWKGNYFIEPIMHRLSWGVRLVLNFLFMYFLLAKAPIGFTASLSAIMLILLGYFARATKQKGLKWERLIHQDAKRMMTFYRLANLFTDVPQLKEQVKRRKWLDVFLPLVSYRQENTFLYLYMRTFFRASDYLGLYIRLIIIACLLIYIVPSSYGKNIVLLFFIYATGFQLYTLSRHHRTKMMIKLYPIGNEQNKQALLRFLFVLLFIQTIILALFVWLTSSLFSAVLSFVSGLLFSYMFLFFYAQKKWN